MQKKNAHMVPGAPEDTWILQIELFPWEGMHLGFIGKKKESDREGWYRVWNNLD